MLAVTYTGFDIIYAARAYNSMKNDFKLYTKHLPEAKVNGYVPPPMPEQLDNIQEMYNGWPLYKETYYSFVRDLEVLGEPIPRGLDAQF